MENTPFNSRRLDFAASCACERCPRRLRRPLLKAVNSSELSAIMAPMLRLLPLGRPGSDRMRGKSRTLSRSTLLRESRLSSLS